MYDDVSKLIKEAKPLYFKRKRFRQRMKVMASLSVFGVMLYAFNTMPQQSYPTADHFDPFMLVEDVSIIETMGLPTDEYGLLKVV